MPSKSRRANRYGLLIAVMSALPLVLVAVASAASPAITMQAAAANAAFLAYAPPPVGGAKALCLVDTGVNATPDTTPGLLSAIALDGGSPNDVDPLWHGTIDAAVAGGAGHGVLGAWPLLKIVSVRATSVPSPGQHPTFQFDDYINGINKCTQRELPGIELAAIVLPLSSVIAPTPDQVQSFRDAAGRAHDRGISILAAAGNNPGLVQLPGSQPGVLAVGAGDAANAICPFSATGSLTFYAPGCGLDQIDTRGEAFCCGNGTSQASVFAAAVLVALRSYKPDLTEDQAVQHLLSTTHNGHVDVATAFRGAGLDWIVDAGTVSIPMVASPSASIGPPTSSVGHVPRPSIRRVTWKRGVLEILLKNRVKGARLHAKVTFARRRPLYVGTSHIRMRVRTPLPRAIELRQSRGSAMSATVTPKVTHLR